VVLNTAITRKNLPTLRAGYEKAKEWGVQISYSCYTPLRTGSMEHYISSPEDLGLLRRTMDELLELQAKNGHITNSAWTLSGIYDFFRDGSIPGCQAGRRFMVVTPDGGLRACSMFDQTYGSHREVMEKFVAHNTCGGCYVSIRAYLDASFWTLLKDNIRSRVLQRNSHTGQC
jgi:MoaA/NifB/PqqE/SkfB family radical SAM enzyme